MPREKEIIIQLQKEISLLKNEISLLSNTNKARSDQEYLIRESQELAKLGTYILDINTLHWESSEVFNKIHGIDNNFEKNLKNWLDLIHPDFKEEIKLFYNNEMLKNNFHFNKEYKIIRHVDKQERWVIGNGEIITNENGNAIKILGTIQDITDKKKIEKDLQDSENRFKALSEATYEGIFFSVDGYCTEANSAGCEMFGYTYKEMLKLFATDIFIDECKEIVITNIRNNYLKPYTVKGLKKDGTVFDVEIQGKIIDYQGQKVRVSAIRDISHRIKAQNELKEQERKFRTVFENAGDGILIGDNKGIVIDANDSFYIMTGLTKEEVINNFIGKLFSDSQLNKKPLRFDLLDKGISLIMERELIGKDGRLIPIEMNSKRLNKDYYISIMRNLTERKKAEEDLRITNLELIKAKEKAEESDQLKSEFLANMSHEIRTPMNGIVGFAKMLNNPNITDEKRKLYTNIIINSSNQLMHIIDDILEISELETKQVKVFSSEVNINNLLFEAFSIYDNKAKENNTPLYLKKELSDDASIIYTDETKFSKIINNLLDNAIRYTKEGYIEIGYKLAGEFLEFYVKDTGIGINPDRHQKIFERFAQEEKAMSNKFRGLGLGLSIAKENVELLGGKIHLESEKGKGSLFKFTLPYKKAVKDNKKIISTNKVNHSVNTFESLNIIIAEDDEINYLFMETLIHNISQYITIYHAKNGNEVIDLCKSKNNISLILMDLKMPEMNGFETAKKIKQILPEIKIIAQTAYTKNEDKKKTEIAGFDGFITKPINEDQLNAIILKELQ